MNTYRRQCKRCGVDFEAKRSDAVFCGAVCRASHRQETKKEEVKTYKKGHYLLNKEKIDSANTANYYANKPILEKRTCQHCDTEFQPTRSDNKYCSKVCGVAFWRLNNKEYIKADQTERYNNDINRKISSCLRTRVNSALNGNTKSASTIVLIGCSVSDFRKHIESQFEPWMTWDNHGVYSKKKQTWHLDHINPMISYDLSDPAQQRLACNYTNQRPLLAEKNLRKGSKSSK